ncbi:MAG: molybdopterin-guanine dinucleotide biosynthesis protein MobB [Desulfonatronovibrionaceae bacterium]
MLKAVSIVGYKNSGKTGLASDLARELEKRGTACAAAKFSSHGFDKQDTDTQRLCASAAPVIGIGPEESAVFWPQRIKLADLAHLAGDRLLIVEGGKSLTILPRIVMARDEEEARKLDNGLALAVWGEEPLAGLRAVSSLSRLADLALEKGFLLPGLDCATCGRLDCLHLAREIVSGAAGPEDCAASNPGTEIRINGRQLALNGFLNEMVTRAILGLISPLKGFAPGEITINIKN